MALSHETVAFDVHDAKVYKLLTDVTGASPTYDVANDVPGIAAVSIDPNLVTAELKGDARVIAKKGRTDRFNFSATYGKLSGDVLKTLMGFTSTDTGSTSSRFRLKSPAPLPYFMIKFKIEDLDEGLGDLHVTLYKCQLTGGTLLGQSSDNFGQPTFTAEGIAIDGTIGTDQGVMADFELLSVATALRA